MKTIKKFWQSVKRNPVIMGFAAAVATQFFQDWRANQIDTAHILGYLSAMILSVAVRQFTIPVQDHQKFVNNRNEDLAKAYDQGIIDGGAE